MADIGEEIATLGELDRLSSKELKARFESLYGVPPPIRMGRDLLMRAVGHRIQENARGGPQKALQRRLKRLIEDLRQNGKVSVVRPASIKSGTRLIREWRGETHLVTALADGFAYQNKTYRSLSQIARLITGTRWSGPAFFGLKGKESRT